MQARLPLEIAVEILWRGNSLAIVWPQYNKPPQSITPAILGATQARNILTRRQKGSARQNQHSLIRGRPLFWLEAVRHFCPDAIFFNLLLRLLVGLILNVVVWCLVWYPICMTCSMIILSLQKAEPVQMGQL